MDGVSNLIWNSTQVIFTRLQATSHYLSQCCPRSLSPYGVIRPQWVNSEWREFLQSILYQFSVVCYEKFLKNFKIYSQWFLLEVLMFMTVRKNKTIYWTIDRWFVMTSLGGKELRIFIFFFLKYLLIVKKKEENLIIVHWPLLVKGRVILVDSDLGMSEWPYLP